MTKFEKGIGVLLANAWMHAEALQTTDLPLLCKHTSNVMATAAETDVRPFWQPNNNVCVVLYDLSHMKTPVLPGTKCLFACLFACCAASVQVQPGRPAASCGAALPAGARQALG